MSLLDEPARQVLGDAPAGSTDQTAQVVQVLFHRLTPNGHVRRPGALQSSALALLRGKEA